MRNLISLCLAVLLLLFSATSLQAQLQVPTKPATTPPAPPVPLSSLPQQSTALAGVKDPKVILQNFKTMYISAYDAKYFDAAQLKADFAQNPDFAKLNITIVDDSKLADTILTVGYTFAWDFPFELKFQNTSVMLLAGKGEGPFSGPAGAADVVKKFVALMKPYRIPPATPAN